MKRFTFTGLLALVGIAEAAVSLYGQCGGSGYAFMFLRLCG